MPSQDLLRCSQIWDGVDDPSATGSSEWRSKGSGYLGDLAACGEHGENSMVQTLLNEGADISAHGLVGMTPLHSAVSSGRAKIAHELIKKGADVNSVASNNITPLHLAAFTKDASVAMLLIDHGAKMDAVASDGQTPLHFAVHQNNERFVKSGFRFNPWNSS